MTEFDIYNLTVQIIGTSCAFGFFVGILISTFGNDRWYK